MSAGTYNFLLERGADFDQLVQWLDSAGSPIDLTGASALMQIKPAPEVSDVYLELSTDNGRIILDPVNGKLHLFVPAAFVSSIGWTNGVYDIFVTLSDGRVKKLLQGNICVASNVTEIP